MRGSLERLRAETRDRKRRQRDRDRRRDMSLVTDLPGVTQASSLIQLRSAVWTGVTRDTSRVGPGNFTLRCYE
jgi:hypothetical protein